MMDYIAQQGWDVYLVDVRGYDGSTRPPEMELPANENKPTGVGGCDSVRVEHVHQAS